MASGSDVRDILALPARAPALAQPVSKGPPKRPKKRLEGMTRELFMLMGDQTAAVELVRPKMVARPKVKAPAAKWHRKEFTNGARTDGMKLQHWVKETEEEVPEYKFAKFNTSSNPLSYTPEEYLHMLRVDGWTREETDFLFELCSTYDLRFIVIADRWDESDYSERTIEDLKERYYDCCRKLIASRNSIDESAKQPLLSSYAFDKAREVSRKDYLRSLIRRTPAQIEEELFLYTESRRLEQEYANVARDREELLRSLAGPGALMSLPANMQIAGAAGVTSAAGGAALTLPPDRKRIRKEDELAVSPVITVGGGKKIKIDPAADAQHCITRFAGPSGTPAAYLRSTRLPSLKPASAQLVRDALAEMGISQRLVMPTRSNQERLEALVLAVGNLVELKRQLDRMSYEVLVEQQRQGIAPPTAAGTLEVPGAEASGSRAPTPAASNTSGTRKRSASISSVDTTQSGQTKKRNRR